MAFAVSGIGVGASALLGLRFPVGALRTALPIPPERRRRAAAPIMDNLSSHKALAACAAIEAAGARLLFVPPYSPDFNPIEQAFSRLKAQLRKAAERTIHGLWNAIGRILGLYSPQECAMARSRTSA